MHEKLPFTLLNSVVTYAFEIVHFDVWTSSVLSNYGFMYYLMFLIQISHYMWVFPIKHNDVFEKNLNLDLMLEINFNVILNNLNVTIGVSIIILNFIIFVPPMTSKCVVLVPTFPNKLGGLDI